VELVSSILSAHLLASICMFWRVVQILEVQLLLKDLKEMISVLQRLYERWRSRPGERHFRTRTLRAASGSSKT
jgi:hypothetical protein